MFSGTSLITICHGQKSQPAEVERLPLQHLKSVASSRQEIAKLEGLPAPEEVLFHGLNLAAVLEFPTVRQGGTAAGVGLLEDRPLDLNLPLKLLVVHAAQV